jgi:hypothetical protein
MGRTGEERCVRRSGATPSSGHTSATAASASPPSLPWECRWGAALPLKRGQAHRELPPSQARRRRLMPSYCCWWRYRKKCVTSCSGKRRAPHGARKGGHRPSHHHLRTSFPGCGPFGGRRLGSAAAEATRRTLPQAENEGKIGADHLWRKPEKPRKNAPHPASLRSLANGLSPSHACMSAASLRSPVSIMRPALRALRTFS